ncbi:hypothetical protein ACJJTC_011024 [Scirpophaga incertulas]
MLQKSQETELPDYQHTPISMEQLHQAMQTSINASTLMHNFQLPLSPRQMSTLMLKTNHLSRNLNFNEIPAHLQRNLELDLVHNLAVEIPQNLRHEDLVLSRNLDLNLARSLSNELELQNGLTQSIVQNLSENLAIPDVLPQNLRNDLPQLNQEIDLSHHLSRNIEQQDLLNPECRSTMQCVQDEQLLGQNLRQQEQILVPRLEQRLVNSHENQRLDGENMTMFHIKSENDEEGYFYDNINQNLPSISNGVSEHITTEPQSNLANQQHDQLFLYSHANVTVNTSDQYPRYPTSFRESPHNLVMHRQFENSSPYEEIRKGIRDEVKIESKVENPKENMKPSDQNKMYYQDNVQKTEMKPEDVSLDIIGEFRCYKCEQVFTSKRFLKQHSKTCTEKDIENSDTLGKFSCTQCSYRCHAPATLKIHERVHSGEKPFSCTFCDYKSGQKNNVAKHILVHMKEKPFSCQYCDYRCAQKNNLVVHERTHTGFKPFACPYCEYRTVQKPNLVKHMYLHTDQKPFSCDMCNYRCVQKTNLTKHKQRHMNEKDAEKIDAKNQVKPYRPRQKSVKCPHCPYRCVQMATLEKHVLFKHSTEYETGLNLMKCSETVNDEAIQNLSVKKDSQQYSVPCSVNKEILEEFKS